MEDKEGISPSSVTLSVKRDEVTDNYHVAPRAENPNPFPGAIIGGAPSATPVSGSTGSDGKKKRGRPRKYHPDGSLALALSPMPISSSIPLTGEYSAWKRGRGKPVDSVKKSHKFEYDTTPGGDPNPISYFVGANFTAHVITVNTGEDIMMKIMTFCQESSRAICILSANGMISNVTLRQSTSSGGTLTYEGRFEILSLSGSSMPTENGGSKSRSGGMSVSLAGPDGRVVGGGLAGMLVAAGPVQLVLGSFLPGHQQEQKQKKPKSVPAAPVRIISAQDMKATYKPIPMPPSYLHQRDETPLMDPVQALRNFAAENKEKDSSSAGGDTSQSNDLST